MISYRPLDNWPTLAWCAICHSNRDDVRVLHGQGVETGQYWFGEVVWAGEFEQAGFDLTDIVSGSGARQRTDKLNFVSSGSIVDRLHYLQIGDEFYVSNSLPCLLSVSDSELDVTNSNYYAELRSVDYGLPGYHRQFECSNGQIEFLYFDNLVWDGKSLSRCAKPASQEAFADFDDYYEFLARSIRSCAQNIADPNRTYKLDMLTTVSTGYDSTCVAAIAQVGGCRQAVTIDKSRAGDSDSGLEVAKHLGMEVHVVDREGWRSEHLAEVPFIAGGPGGGGSVYLKSAESALAGTVLFTGLGGGLMWGMPQRDNAGNALPIGFSDASLTEYRLSVGFIHCVLPLWGMRRPDDIFRITESSEMQPWSVPGSYNRPIARRIAESAGVPREAFGMTKRAAAFMLHQPFSSGESLSASSARDFHLWLKESRGAWLRRFKLPPTRSISFIVDVLIYLFAQLLQALRRIAPTKGLRHSLGKKIRDLGHFARRPVGSIRGYTFPWAVRRMQNAYDAEQENYGQVG